MEKSYIIAFDTANETVALGLGRLDRASQAITCVDHAEIPAFRASNTKLIPSIDGLLTRNKVSHDQIVCVVCGRGPGSFTGVRICLATAKGMALGLGVALYGVSTLDAQAWELWLRGVRGTVMVLGDAMRKEVYPLRYRVTEEGIERLGSESVIKARDAVDLISEDDLVTGDALLKYGDECGAKAPLADKDVWQPTGRGLLLATQAAWRLGQIDPDDVIKGNPSALLPIYTRLSDAEEHERQAFAKESSVSAEAVRSADHVAASRQAALSGRDLVTGVQGEKPEADLHDDHGTIRCVPLEARWVDAVAALEQDLMGSDAWNAAQILDELPRSDRTWWAAYLVADVDNRTIDSDHDKLVGYAGGWIVDGQLQILKVATDAAYQRRGIARTLIEHLANDARDLGAHEATLEVRRSNASAQKLYETLGLEQIGIRPGYYSDHEDACIYTGPLPTAQRDVAGMDLHINETTSQNDEIPTLQGGLILALESSCDETAAALVDEAGTIIADVVASQIDFHARFGGVVPEIASRKHIEAIGGVAQECLLQAEEKLQRPVQFKDLSAVGVTYAPGLVGALVVGLAFAKGLAWSIEKPLVGVNHLEGHIYANKIACPDITPPMVVSLVSGGHTMLVHVRDWGDYETLGSTLDDAVGEAFDKVAKAFGLGYPGGPIISKLAAEGNPKAVTFPRALLHSGDLAFSLSGLKTAVTTYIQKEKQAGHSLNLPDIAASFQQAVIDVQVAKAQTALEQTGARELCLGGGVAANPALRAAYEQMCDKQGVRLTMPPLSACTDNASMIALVACERFRQEKFMGLDADVAAHAALDDPY